MISPFIILVLAGFGSFMAVLGTVWMLNYIGDVREARSRVAASRAPAHLRTERVADVQATDRRAA